MNKKSVDWKICGSFKILLVRLSLAKGQWARLFWLKPLRYHILDTKYFFFITLDSQVPNTSYYQVQHFCPLDPKHLIWRILIYFPWLPNTSYQVVNKLSNEDQIFLMRIFKICKFLFTFPFWLIPIRLRVLTKFWKKNIWESRFMKMHNIVVIMGWYFKSVYSSDGTKFF